MDGRKSRAFQPELEGAERRFLLTGVAKAASHLPPSGSVDLKPTELINDLKNSLVRTTPHDGRQGWSLRLLQVDPSTRLVYGGLTLLYRAKTVPGFFTTYTNRQKLKVDIAFITPLDAPKVKDVKVVVSHPNINFGPNVRKEMAVGIVQFIQNDHDLIASALPSAKV